MTFSVWLEPSYHDAKYLNNIVNGLAKKYGAPKFHSHITLYSRVISLAKAKEAVIQCKSSRLCVRTTNIGHSNYLWKTIFVNVKKDSKLRNLNLILKRNLNTKYDFEPHISLIYKRLDPATKRKIIAGLKIRKSFVFDKITIIKSSKNVDSWKKLYSVRLKATGNA